MLEKNNGADLPGFESVIFNAGVEGVAEGINDTPDTIGLCPNALPQVNKWAKKIMDFFELYTIYTNPANGNQEYDLMLLQNIMIIWEKWRDNNDLQTRFVKLKYKHGGATQILNPVYESSKWNEYKSLEFTPPPKNVKDSDALLSHNNGKNKHAISFCISTAVFSFAYKQTMTDVVLNPKFKIGYVRDAYKATFLYSTAYLPLGSWLKNEARNTLALTTSMYAPNVFDSAGAKINKILPCYWIDNVKKNIGEGNKHYYQFKSARITDNEGKFTNEAFELYLEYTGDTGNRKSIWTDDEITLYYLTNSNEITNFKVIILKRNTITGNVVEVIAKIKMNVANNPGENFVGTTVLTVNQLKNNTNLVPQRRYNPRANCLKGKWSNAAESFNYKTGPSVDYLSETIAAVSENKITGKKISSFHNWSLPQMSLVPILLHYYNVNVNTKNFADIKYSSKKNELCKLLANLKTWGDLQQGIVSSLINKINLNNGDIWGSVDPLPPYLSENPWPRMNLYGTLDWLSWIQGNLYGNPSLFGIGQKLKIITNDWVVKKSSEKLSGSINIQTEFKPELEATKSEIMSLLSRIVQKKESLSTHKTKVEQLIGDEGNIAVFNNADEDRLLELFAGKGVPLATDTLDYLILSVFVIPLILVLKNGMKDPQNSGNDFLMIAWRTYKDELEKLLAQPSAARPAFVNGLLGDNGVENLLPHGDDIEREAAAARLRPFKDYINYLNEELTYYNSFSLLELKTENLIQIFNTNIIFFTKISNGNYDTFGNMTALKDNALVISKMYQYPVDGFPDLNDWLKDRINTDSDLLDWNTPFEFNQLCSILEDEGDKNIEAQEKYMCILRSPYMCILKYNSLAQFVIDEGFTSAKNSSLAAREEFLRKHINSGFFGEIKNKGGDIKYEKTPLIPEALWIKIKKAVPGIFNLNIPYQEVITKDGDLNGQVLGLYGLGAKYKVCWGNIFLQKIKDLFICLNLKPDTEQFNGFFKAYKKYLHLSLFSQGDSQFLERTGRSVRRQSISMNIELVTEFLKTDCLNEKLINMSFINVLTTKFKEEMYGDSRDKFIDDLELEMIDL